VMQRDKRLQTGKAAMGPQLTQMSTTPHPVVLVLAGRPSHIDTQITG
jgi:hypothetical protein